MKRYAIHATNMKAYKKGKDKKNSIFAGGEILYTKLMEAKNAIEDIIAGKKGLSRSDFEIRQFEIRSTGRIYN